MHQLGVPITEGSKIFLHESLEEIPAADEFNGNVVEDGRPLHRLGDFRMHRQTKRRNRAPSAVGRRITVPLCAEALGIYLALEQVGKARAETAEEEAARHVSESDEGGHGHAGTPSEGHVPQHIPNVGDVEDGERVGERGVGLGEEDVAHEHRLVGFEHDWLVGVGAGVVDPEDVLLDDEAEGEGFGAGLVVRGGQFFVNWIHGD